MIAGAEAGAAQEPLQADEPAPNEAGVAIKRDRLLRGDLEIEFEMVLQILADAGRSATTSIPSARSSAAGPTPESLSNCGELIAPPHRITSRRAPALVLAPPRP